MKIVITPFDRLMFIWDVGFIFIVSLAAVLSLIGGYLMYLGDRAWKWWCRRHAR